MLAIPITITMADPNLFSRWYAGNIWATWTGVLKAAYGLPMTIGEIRTSRRAPPAATRPSKAFVNYG